MASTANNFSNLAALGAGENVAQKKKKKANKPKESADANGHHPAASSVVEAFASAVTVSDPAQSLVVDVSEAKAVFERAAREARSLSDKVKLWRDWTKQALDRTGKGMKYKDHNGVLVSFREVVLMSTALEISISSCIAAGLTADKAGALSQLLTAFLPAEPETAEDLTSALVKLSSYMVDESPDAVGAAQRAASSIVTALKVSGQDGEQSDAAAALGWLSRIATIDKEISRQQGLLQKLGISNKGVITREITNCAKQLVKLQEEKFDLLQPHSIPAAKAPTGTLGACLKSIQELKAVVGNHVKEAEAGSQGADMNRLLSQAAYKHEEALLQAQAAEVGSQIRVLEAQLRSLRSQQSEVEDKLVQIRARQQQGAWESAKPKQGLTVAQYRDELAAAQALENLMDPSKQAGASAEQIDSVRAAQVDSPASYLSDAEQFLGMALKALSDIPAKITFCKQRLDKAAKLAQLGAAVGEKVMQDSRNQKEEADKLMADTMRMAEELVSSSLQVRSEVANRFDSLTRFNPAAAQSVLQQVRGIEALASQVQDLYASVLTGAAAPLPPAPPPAPRTAAAAAATAEAPSATAPAARPASAVPATRPTAPQPQKRNVAPAEPRPVSAGPPKQWGKVEAPVAVSLANGDGLPTPAEAFKGPSSSSAAGPSDDGFSMAKRNNRRKA